MVTELIFTRTLVSIKLCLVYGFLCYKSNSGVIVHTRWKCKKWVLQFKLLKFCQCNYNIKAQLLLFKTFPWVFFKLLSLHFSFSLNTLVIKDSYGMFCDHCTVRFLCLYFTNAFFYKEMSEYFEKINRIFLNNWFYRHF